MGFGSKDEWCGTIVKYSMFLSNFIIFVSYALFVLVINYHNDFEQTINLLFSDSIVLILDILYSMTTVKGDMFYFFDKNLNCKKRIMFIIVKNFLIKISIYVDFD